MRLSSPVVGLHGTVMASFTVTNNGSQAAEEVVQLYVRDQVSSVTTVVQQLRNFTRLQPIEAGASVRVSMELDVQRDLWLIDSTYTKVVEAGAFTIMVGGSSDKIQQKATLRVVA